MNKGKPKGRKGKGQKMKQYGAHKATEFSKKQINVIFAKAKKGDLKVEKWYMSELYNLADYYGYDDSKSVEFDEAWVLRILEAVFSGDNEEAQKLIDSTTENWFNRYSLKAQAGKDRSYL